MWVKPMEPIDWETSPATEQPGRPPSPHPTPPNRQQRHEKQVSVTNPAAIKHRKPGATASHPTVGKAPPAYCIFCLKTLTDGACLVSVGRLFQSFAPRYEKLFCPFADVFCGSLKSVFVLRRLRELRTIVISLSQRMDSNRLQFIRRSLNASAENCFARETNSRPYCFDTSCFGFVVSISRLGVTTSCASLLLFPLLSSTVKLIFMSCD